MVDYVEDPAVLQARLAEADAALHKLLVGGARTSVTYNGQELRNTPADKAALRAYIAELKGKLGFCGRSRGRRIVF